MKTLVLLAFFLVPVVAIAASAENAAKIWLGTHQTPTDSQLGELASANPQAFAIVSALLNKRHQNTLPESERGADVFLKMMGPRHASVTPADASVSMPYNIPGGAEGQATVQNQMRYDPASTEDKDEAMVDGLLGAVEGIAGAKGSKIALLRKKRQHNEVQKAVVDGPFGNPFGNAAPKPKAPSTMSEEEKEQRVAAGLPLTSDINTMTVPIKQNQPFHTDVPAAEETEPQQVDSPKPAKESALMRFLR